jgi:hypothetical protein
MTKIPKIEDVHAVAYGTQGNFEIKVTGSKPDNTDGLMPVLEPIDADHQLFLWVPEETSGEVAQNLATHLVPNLRKTTTH